MSSQRFTSVLMKQKPRKVPDLIRGWGASGANSNAHAPFFAGAASDFAPCSSKLDSHRRLLAARRCSLPPRRVPYSATRVGVRRAPIQFCPRVSGLPALASSFAAPASELVTTLLTREATLRAAPFAVNRS